MKRIVIPELLGTDAGTPEEVAGSLADLRMFNRWFGGTRVMRKLVERVTAERKLTELRWLDVAGASGDIAAILTREFSRYGVTLRPALLDRAADHLPGNMASVQGDALELPFADGSFDIVSTSLLVHDLEPAEILQFLREGLRVARHAVLINELRRSWTHLGLVYAGMPLYRSRITRNDAVASVRKAYTESELRGIVVQTGAPAEFYRYYLCRLGVLIWKA